MEEKVMYNTLKSIGTGKEFDTAPDGEYLKALEKVGLIKLGWENTLTTFGRSTLNSLSLKINKW